MDECEPGQTRDDVDATLPLSEDSPPPPPPGAQYGVMYGIGTLEQAIGPEDADKFFSEPSPYDEARRSAYEKLRRGHFLGNMAVRP